MLRLLASGVTLVVDRYSYSGIAYTAAKVPELWRTARTRLLVRHQRRHCP